MKAVEFVTTLDQVSHCLLKSASLRSSGFDESSIAISID